MVEIKKSHFKVGFVSGERHDALNRAGVMKTRSQMPIEQSMSTPKNTNE